MAKCMLHLILLAAPNSPAAPFLDAARAVTASIQQRYWLDGPACYARSLTDRHPDFLWGGGIMFSALVAAARHDPATWRPQMARYFGGLNGYWDAQAPIPGYEPAPTNGNGHDKYYDDNAWMVLTFLEAYDLTGKTKYLDRADDTLRFVLSGWDEALGGGIWWHEGHKDDSRNTCSNAPAAVACVRMAAYRRREENLAWACRLVAWTSEHLQDKDGLFFDSVKVGSGKINRDKLTYNTALMLRANLGLWRATGEERYRKEADRIGLASDWFVGQTGAYRDPPKWSHLLVEADLEWYRETGAARGLERARRNAEGWWERWQAEPPQELIEQASIARMLWLLADWETEAARER
ncbi:MAG: hypothetical protein HYU66_19465 [Armatimonadetes bacterium]|nr:hypothetical protein [Armatimonadota bacterium]